MHKLLTVVWVSLTAALVILVFQNLSRIELQVFFTKVTVSTSLLIAGVWVIGALTGRPLFRLIVRALRGGAKGGGGDPAGSAGGGSSA